MLAEWAAGKTLDIVFKKATAYLSDSDVQLSCTRDDVQSALELQQKGVQRWCEEINFSDLKMPRKTMNVYVALSVYVLPRSVRLEPNEHLECRTLDAVFEESNDHLILLGQPGAGKSTSMKYVCHRLLFDETFLPDSRSFPIVLRLRDMNLNPERESKSILHKSLVLKAIAELFGLSLNLSRSKSARKVSEEQVGFAEGIVLLFLEELKPVLILDGFDELSSREAQETVIHEIRVLTRQLAEARIIVTSRTGDFPYQIDNASCFEICSLSKSQITDFANKWLSEPKRAERFIQEVQHSPFVDTAIKPLTLAHLCAIYDRLGRIPEKPKTVYRKVVNLLIEEWDEQRSVKRHTQYSNFSQDRKFDFLCRLAYELTFLTQGSVFSREHMQVVYGKMCDDFELASGESKRVLAELESHTGLFVQAGYHSYEFAHRSLQEYLAAEYIKGLPSIPEKESEIIRLPNELAIATAISTNPSRYLVELVMTRLRKATLPAQFFSTFVARLLQEKPEFNSEDGVILSLLSLYSCYLDGNPKPGQQMSLFIFDELASEFENVMELLLRRNDGESIRKYYAEFSARISEDGDKIMVLKKTCDCPEMELPEYVFAREAFFESLLAPLQIKDWKFSKVNSGVTCNSAAPLTLSKKGHGELM